MQCCCKRKNYCCEFRGQWSPRNITYGSEMQVPPNVPVIWGLQNTTRRFRTDLGTLSMSSFAFSTFEPVQVIELKTLLI